MPIAQTACRLSKDEFKRQEKAVEILQVSSDHLNLIFTVSPRQYRIFDFVHIELLWKWDPYFRAIQKNR